MCKFGKKMKPIWNTLYSGITKQLWNIFSIFREFTLSLVQINVVSFQFPIGSKQLAVH